MSDYRFGSDDYRLNYYPPEAGDCWGSTDWEKVERVEIEDEVFVREHWQKKAREAEAERDGYREKLGRALGLAGEIAGLMP